MNSLRSPEDLLATHYVHLMVAALLPPGRLLSDDSFFTTCLLFFLSLSFLNGSSSKLLHLCNFVGWLLRCRLALIKIILSESESGGSEGKSLSLAAKRSLRRVITVKLDRQVKDGWVTARNQHKLRRCVSPIKDVLLQSSLLCKRVGKLPPLPSSCQLWKRLTCTCEIYF